MMSHPPTSRLILVALCGLLFAAPPLSAQRPAGPAAPALYDAQLRYRIRAARTERIRQFDAMTLALEKAGFQREASDDPNEPADPNAERLRGTLAASKVQGVLLEPHVRTLLLMPAGYKLPDNPEQRVLVQLELYSNLSPTRQKDLALQTKERLAALGFVEKVGYDNRKNTRILGTITAGEVETLLKDLRDTPGGWLAPETPRDALPDPIRDHNPIRIAEVIAEPEGVPPSADAPAPVIDAALEKIAPDLLPEVTKEGATERIRMEVVLTRAPVGIEDTAWREFLRSAGDLVIEGRVGQIVTIYAPASVAKVLAPLPQVATVRPPRVATRQPIVQPKGIPAEVFGCTGLGQLHGLGFRGAGVRVAVIDENFAGAAKLLPGATIIDLTAARNPSLAPDPTPAGEDVGRGTKAGLAVKLAAPEAELVLIRIDPAAAYMLADAAQYLHGNITRPEYLLARNRELLAENERLRILRAQVAEDRRPRDDDFDSDEASVQRRKEREQRAKDLLRDEAEYLVRLQRMAKLEEDLYHLRSVRVVVNPLAWDIGYPTDGFGPLSRYIDEALFGRPPAKPYGSPKPVFGPPLWFQATGDTRGQSWNGTLTDADGNGVFEFAANDAALPKDAWTNEINFLAFQPVTGNRTIDLPAGAKVRLALQWSEAHDPDADSREPDPYRTPLADLSLLVLRQRDSSNTKLAADDFNVVARSVKLPQLIGRSSNVATYEQIVEFTVDTPGRFAVRLEGSISRTIRPDGLPSGLAQRYWEPRGRLFVEVADPATFANGRVVFGDYTPGVGGLGTPGDAVFPRTVGACDLQGLAQPYSAYGPYSGRDLLFKPTFLTPDELPLQGVKPSAGTALSNAFAGGMLASMISAGAPQSSELKWMCIPPYGLLKVPPAWLEQLNRREPHLNERK